MNKKKICAAITIFAIIGMKLFGVAPASAQEINSGNASDYDTCTSATLSDGSSTFYCERYEGSTLVSIVGDCAGRCTNLYQIAIVNPYGPDALSVGNIPSNALTLPTISTNPEGVRERLTRYLPTHVAVIGGERAVSTPDMRAAFFAVYDVVQGTGEPVVFDRFYGQNRADTMLATFDANLPPQGATSGK